MKKASWICPKKTQGSVHQDPVHEEFFSREDIAEGLVRECIQNSLDAGTGKSVRVRFTFSKKPLSASAAKVWMGGLVAHAEAAYKDELTTTGPMGFLTIEDFGTRGLCGDAEQLFDAEEDGPKNDFYWFWRNVGRSLKGETDRGRWGLGKVVYPAASMARTFFGLTVRKESPRSLLMGQAVLKMHRIGREWFDAYPFFGVPGDADTAIPIDEAETQASFKETFELERANEPGLSVVVPYLRDEVTSNGILTAAIRNYYYPILSGELTVETRRGDTVIALDAGSIRKVTKSLQWSDVEEPARLERLFDLCAWAIGLDEGKFVRLNDRGGEAAAWVDELFDDVDLKNLRQRFEGNERLAFRLPVKVERRGHGPKTTWFSVFLEKDDSIKRAEEQYIRRGITISEIHRVRDAQIRGLVVVDDADLSSLLGDAEGPAHSDWSERDDKLRRRYQHGATSVRFVKNALKELAGFLEKPPEGMREDLLSDVFFVWAPLSGTDAGTKLGRTTETQEKEPAPLTITGRKPDRFKVTRVDGGFKVTADPGFRGTISVQAAYEVRRGNPFSRYSPNDFSVDSGQISIDKAGCRLAKVSANEIEFVIESDGFRALVTGFDPNRDLAVKATCEGVEAAKEDA